MIELLWMLSTLTWKNHNLYEWNYPLFDVYNLQPSFACDSINSNTHSYVESPDVSIKLIITNECDATSFISPLTLGWSNNLTIYSTSIYFL